jgi:hypothetical protein
MSGAAFYSFSAGTDRRVNQVYARYITKIFPARSAIQV